MSTTKNTLFFPRQRELATINDFLSQEGSGLTYLRGRRRIGKSTLLKKLASDGRDTFYFQGLPDANDIKTRKEFINSFSKFSNDSYLLDLKEDRLTWPLIFLHILKVAKKNTHPIIILLDEIQWISKFQSGFLGYLKEAWLDWRKSGKIKLIISGSSNKFFTKNIHNSEAPLRGLSTYSEIWVLPFSLKEISEYYFPKWSKEEVCLIDMMLGGVPYYLEAIASNKSTNDKGFILAVNEAVFQQKTIFLNEVDEILNLEFSNASMRNIKLILSTIGIFGATEEKIVKVTGISQSSVSEQINKLLNYNIIFEQEDVINIKRGNKRGVRYCCKDPFLVFYFQVLQSYTERIKLNRSGLLFDQLIKSKSGYYIEDFTGKAFEDLIKRILENRFNLNQKLFKKLNIVSPEYKLGNYLDTESQFDIIIDSKDERELRVIEAKWISGKDKLTREILKNFSEKEIKLPKNYNRKISKFLCTSLSYNKEVEEMGEEFGIKILFVEDLF